MRGQEKGGPRVTSNNFLQEKAVEAKRIKEGKRVTSGKCRRCIRILRFDFERLYGYYNRKQFQ
jgi:hypothetical protein